MIRKFKDIDSEAAMKIWLESNVDVHSFVPQSYWKDNFDMVKDALAVSQVYVYEWESKVLAFAGISDGHIEGIFVDAHNRSGGIGRELLDHCKELYDRLSLCVYVKNDKAVSFYLREGFHIQKAQTNEWTGQREYIMSWEKAGRENSLRDGMVCCPCPKIKCECHEQCDFCIIKHESKKSKPYCERNYKSSKNKFKK